MQSMKPAVMLLIRSAACCTFGLFSCFCRLPNSLGVLPYLPAIPPNHHLTVDVCLCSIHPNGYLGLLCVHCRCRTLLWSWLCSAGLKCWLKKDNPCYATARARDYFFTDMKQYYVMLCWCVFGDLRHLFPELVDEKAERVLACAAPCGVYGGTSGHRR